MDLKVYVKWILSFIICIWRSGNVNSMECEIGDSMSKFDVSARCYSEPGFSTSLKKNCELFSCKLNESVEWKIIDPERGKLQVQFNSLPKTCNFEEYLVVLEVYDELAPYNETLVCDTGNKPWKMHSKRTLENNICSNCSVSSSEECLQVNTVHFKYVYPGFYRIKVTPFEKGSTRQAQRSYRMHINSTVTNYVKKKFIDLSLNASLQYRSTAQELDLGIPLLLDDPPDVLIIEVKFSRDYINLYGITKYGNENSTSIQCEEKEKSLWPTCQVHRNGLLCKFYNMTQGFYGVDVRFKDDRCMGGTVWATDFPEPCYWVIEKEFLVDGTMSNTITPGNQSTSSEILYTTISLVIVVGVITIFFIARKVSRRRQRLENGIIGKTSDNARKNTAEQTYNFNNGHASRFNFGQLLTLTERPRPEVLLVYTRETPPFMELVACLRRILDKICKCQVYDYFDPDLWNHVSEDPKGWVHALIVERQAKVIIIASEVAAIRHRSLMGEFPQRSYKSPHPFDHLFLYALRLLRDGMDEESYKNHFIVTFDGFTESNHLLEYFNPYTRFILPKHLNKLFEHLHDPDTTIHFDTSRLEERYEVRNLRLQLEHLINLKLLAKSDVDTHKLYDW